MKMPSLGQREVILGGGAPPLALPLGISLLQGMDRRPKFFAYRSVDDAINDNGFRSVRFDTVDMDEGGYYNLAQYRWEVPVGAFGIVWTCVTEEIAWSSPPSSAEYSITLSFSGLSSLMRNASITPGTYVTPGVVMSLAVEGGNRAAVVTDLDEQPTTRVVKGGKSKTWFAGMLL